MSEVGVNPPSDPRPSTSQVLIAGWGVMGVVGLLGQAIWRLGGRSLQAFREGELGLLELAFTVGWVAIMAYAEGYRAFQQHLVPRTVLRAFHLGANPRTIFVLLAPAFCLSLLHATRRRLVASWTLLLGISGLVLAVHRLPFPWRGLIDAGVAVGLGWGAIAMLVQFGRALTGARLTGSADLPEERIAR